MVRTSSNVKPNVWLKSPRLRSWWPSVAQWALGDWVDNFGMGLTICDLLENTSRESA